MCLLQIKLQLQLIIDTGDVIGIRMNNFDNYFDCLNLCSDGQKFIYRESFENNQKYFKGNQIKSKQKKNNNNKTTTTTTKANCRQRYQEHQIRIVVSNFCSVISCSKDLYLMSIGFRKWGLLKE